MKLSRVTLVALLSCAALGLISCNDNSPVGPQAPQPAVQADLLGTLSQTVNNLGLLTCSALPAATTVQTIGPAGGVITVGPHTLTIPAGALAQNVTITASIKSETVNRVRFKPDGLTFSKDATLTMSYANCGLTSSLTLKGIAYVKENNLKILEHLLSIDNILAQTVSARLEHFSDYAVEERSYSDHNVAW